jgi:hypothetical protein
MFILSFYEVPKGVLQKLDFYRSRFFWQGDDHKKKYRIAKWKVICRPKDQGGNWTFIDQGLFGKVMIIRINI